MSTLDQNPYFAVRQAFDAPWPGPRGPRLTLRNGDIALEIFPEDGARIASLSAFDYELLRQWNPARRAFQYGCFPMVPWVGRLNDGKLGFNGASHQLPVNKPPHALHGMACFAPWRLVEADGQRALMELALDAPWPWRGTARQLIEVAENAVTISLTVSTDDAPFPAAAGWHPWFSKWTGSRADVAAVPNGNAAEMLDVRFNAHWQEEIGANEVPTGKRQPPRPGPWDDCFGFDGAMEATLVWPGKVQLDMSSPASSMVVFDKQADATCVEPLTGPPNGVNTCPHIVTSDNPLTISTRWALSRI